MRSTVHIEAQCLDLSDDDLTRHIGYLFEYIKRLQDEKSQDDELKELKQAAKDYSYDNYDRDIKLTTHQLRAARKVAKLRGLRLDQWKESISS